MTPPSTAYKISKQTISVDATGNQLQLSSLTMKPSTTTANYTSLNTVVNQSGIATVVKNTTALNTSGVNLVLSDGSTNTIFDSVYTGLNTLEFMMARNQYYLMASDDVMLINVDGVKLLILATSFMNQKLMNSFSFHYIRGKVSCIHRNLATIMNLTDALISVGYKKSSVVAFANNYDLQDNLTDVNRPRIQVFDINYSPNPTSSTDSSQLEDSPPNNYN